MTGLALISLLGTLILVLGVRLLLQSRNRRHSPIVTLKDYADAREALDSVFVETAAVKRIFSAEDAEFIKRSAPRDVQHLFLKERRTLALQWLRATREQVARLMDLHLRLAGYTNDPNPGFELMLTAKYLAFMLVSNIGSILLRFSGPAKLTHVTSYTIRAAADFCTTFSLRLERVNPTRLSSSLVH